MDGLPSERHPPCHADRSVCRLRLVALEVGGGGTCLPSTRQSRTHRADGGAIASQGGRAPPLWEQVARMIVRGETGDDVPIPRPLDYWILLSLTPASFNKTGPSAGSYGPRASEAHASSRAARFRANVVRSE